MEMDMPMEAAVPAWLTPVAWTYVALALLSGAVIAADVHRGRRRLGSVATELVWITSALYLGPFAIPLYLSRGRASASSASVESARARGGAALAVLTGGGASAVAHLVGVPLVVAVGWTIAGSAMWAMIIVIAVLAVVMLAGYDHVAGRSSRTGRHVRRSSIGAAIFAAVLTVAAFDIGMVGWMVLLHVNDMMPPVTESTFWFLMQIGVVVGLLTGYPAVQWLLRRNRAVVPG